MQLWEKQVCRVIPARVELLMFSSVGKMASSVDATLMFAGSEFKWQGTVKETWSFWNAFLPFIPKLQQNTVFRSHIPISPIYNMNHPYLRSHQLV